MEPDRAIDSELRDASAGERPPAAGSSELAARRRAISQRFDAWLDLALHAEEPPAGVAAQVLAEMLGEPQVEAPSAGAGQAAEGDLYAVWAELTALKQEVKLQGRSFKQLHEAISPLADRTGELLEAHGEALDGLQELTSRSGALEAERAAAALREATERERRAGLTLLLDLRDRLLRGVEAAEAHALGLEARLPRPAGFVGRLLGGGLEPAAHEELVASAAAVWKSAELTLGVCDEALSAAGVDEIPSLGEVFDPHVMRAVELDHTGHAQDGQVVAVVRRGYVRNGELLRAAEVKVARTAQRPAGGDADGGSG